MIISIITWALMVIAGLLIILFSLKFCLRMYYNVEFSNNLDAFLGLASLLSIILLISMLISNNLEFIIAFSSKFSFIPMFIFFHFFIWYMLIFTLSLFYLMIYILITGIKKDLSLFISIKFIKELILSVYKLIKGNKYLDPFKDIKIKLHTKLSIHKLKSIIFAFYLIAGILVISPGYNYALSLTDLKPFLSILKTDYDTYQKVFIVSLIPYFLNFAFPKSKN